MKSKLLKIIFLLAFFGSLSFVSPVKTLATCPFGDMACGKGTTSSGSTWVYWPQCAIDGWYNGEQASYGCLGGLAKWFQSNTSSNNWIQIDLGAAYPIVKVKMLSGGFNWWGSNTTVCLSADTRYWTNNNCILANSSTWGDWVWGEVNLSSNYRYLTVIANNFQGTWREIEAYCTAAQSCPTTCHTDTQYVPNGACGQTTCPPNAPAAQSCPTTCHTETQYVPNGACGYTACPPNTNIVSCGAWGVCSNVCGSPGTQTQSCTTQCGSTVTQSQACTDTSGTAVTSCGSWSTCSNTCGGTGSQSRTCNTASCGTVTQSQACTNTSSVGIVNSATCGAWSTCSNTCGGTGTQSRTCQDLCGYPVTQSQSCTDTSGTAVTSCGSWSTCSNTCGGTGSQSRTCTTASCGTTTQTQSCTSTANVGVVNPSTCSAWGACSNVCGGASSQTRTCQDYCGNPVTQSQACTDTSGTAVTSCGSWSTCSNTCGGTGSQSRTCQDLCGYPVTQSQSCTDSSGTTVTSCGSWSTCSNTCGGTGSQSRTCNTASCGTTTQTQSCTNTSSVGIVNPSTCGSWGACDTKCGLGSQSRTCQDLCGYSLTQTQSCTDTSNVGVLNPASCSAWGPCSGAACGTGTQTRTCRDFCNNPIVPDQTQSCTVPGLGTVSGGISNATAAVSVCATKTGGGSCPSPVCSSPSQTSYSLTLSGGCNYKLSAGPISGLTVKPDDFTISTECVNSLGPRFWYLSSAGIVGAGAAINSGSGYISQGGTPPPPAGVGLNLQNYNNQTPLSKVNYSEFLKAVLRNARSGSPFTKTELEGQINCQNGSGLAATTTGAGQSFDWYCYTGAAGNFDSQLSAAISAGSLNVKILYPYQFTGTVTATAKTLAAGDNIIAFVPGTLQVDGNITVPATVNNASAVFILDTGGNLNVKSTVSELDGVYIFPGTFNDSYENAVGNNLLLNGFGSLLGTGTSSWTLQRTVPKSTGPAEAWIYQPKYLTIYNNIFSVAQYANWRELPPQ